MPFKLSYIRTDRDIIVNSYKQLMITPQNFYNVTDYVGYIIRPCGWGSLVSYEDCVGLRARVLQGARLIRATH
jgi:hypothetical protein